MDETQFNELMRKMDILIKLASFDAMKGRSKTDQILRLSDLGFDNKEIAEIVGTTSLTVRVTKSTRKKKKSRKKRIESEEGTAPVKIKQENP